MGHYAKLASGDVVDVNSDVYVGRAFIVGTLPKGNFRIRSIPNGDEYTVPRRYMRRSYSSTEKFKRLSL